MRFSGRSSARVWASKPIEYGKEVPSRLTQRRAVFAPDVLSDKRIAILIIGGGTGVGRGWRPAGGARCRSTPVGPARSGCWLGAADQVSDGRAGAARYQTVDVRHLSAVDRAMDRSGTATARSPDCSTRPRRTSSPLPRPQPARLRGGDVDGDDRIVQHNDCRGQAVDRRGPASRAVEPDHWVWTGSAS